MKTTQLVEERNGEAVTTSLKIAKSFGKTHKEIIDAITNLGCSEIFTFTNIDLCLLPPKSRNQATEERFIAYFTRDGFALLSGMFTDPESVEIKEEYFLEFSRAEFRLFGGSILNACDELSEQIKDQKRLMHSYMDIYRRSISANSQAIALQK